MLYTDGRSNEHIRKSKENQGCAKDMKEFQVMNCYFFTELNFFNFLFSIIKYEVLTELLRSLDV
jgi:hypothetical protein